MNAIQLSTLIATILYPPIVWVLVFFGSRKSKRYWLWASLGVIGHLLFVPFAAVTLALSNAEPVDEVFTDIDPALAIVLMSFVFLIGVVASAVIVLLVSGRRMAVLVILSIVSVVAFLRVFDNVEFDPYLYLAHQFQEKEIIFHGSTVKFASPYFYYLQKGDGPDAENSLTIQRINPGYAGLEDYYYLQARPDAQRIQDRFVADCEKGEFGCSLEESTNYKTISFASKHLNDVDTTTHFYYYSPNCDIYLTHTLWSDGDRQIYSDFIEYFFNQSCRST